jgi:hypothetical protein
MRRIRRRGDPGRQWLSFLQNHREVIAAFDFFTVPTLTFQTLYCFFVTEHGRRCILHFNVTGRPTAAWVCNNCAKHSRKQPHIARSVSESDAQLLDFFHTPNAGGEFGTEQASVGGLIGESAYGSESSIDCCCR